MNQKGWVSTCLECKGKKKLASVQRRSDIYRCMADECNNEGDKLTPLFGDPTSRRLSAYCSRHWKP